MNHEAELKRFLEIDDLARAELNLYNKPPQAEKATTVTTVKKQNQNHWVIKFSLSTNLVIIYLANLFTDGTPTQTCIPIILQTLCDKVVYTSDAVMYTHSQLIYKTTVSKQIWHKSLHNKLINTDLQINSL